MMSNIEFELAEQFALYTRKHCFITGKAGTGKTTLLRKLAQGTRKNIVVVAPTGVAAVNAGGVTIHSMFGLPLTCFVPTDDSVDPNVATNRRQLLSEHLRLRSEKVRVLRELELLIIDEVSMVRCDTLDAIDLVLRTLRRNHHTFGGENTCWSKIEQLYGARFLDEQLYNGALRHTRYTPPVLADASVRGSKGNGSTFQATLDLHRQGKTADEIAAIHGLSMGTIKTHLARWITNGEIDVYDVLPAATVDTVLAFMRENQGATLKAIRDGTGGQFKYNDIRMIVAPLACEHFKSKSKEGSPSMKRSSKCPRLVETRADTPAQYPACD